MGQHSATKHERTGPISPRLSGEIVIHRLGLRMSNVYLAQSRGTVLFDSGSQGEEGLILRWIASLGLPHPQTIILTHAHADHVGSAAALRRLTSARICLAPPDWPVARAGRNGPLRAVRPSALPLKHLVPNRFEPFEPDIALDGSVSMTDLGLEATLLQTPGHTAGSVSIAFPDGQAVVGDLLMGGYAGGHLFPRVPRLHYFADDPSENRRSLAKVLKNGVKRLLVGHGGPLRAEDIQERSLA